MFTKRKSKAKPSETAPEQSPELISKIKSMAYQFWLLRGCEHGHDVEDWLAAEAEVLNQANNESKG